MTSVSISPPSGIVTSQLPNHRNLYQTCSNSLLESLTSQSQSIPHSGGSDSLEDMKIRGKWTHEEVNQFSPLPHSSPHHPSPSYHHLQDEILRTAVLQHGGKNWKKISENLSGRSDVQCLHRWQKVLKPGLIKGPWTKEVLSPHSSFFHCIVLICSLGR